MKPRRNRATVIVEHETGDIPLVKTRSELLASANVIPSSGKPLGNGREA